MKKKLWVSTQYFPADENGLFASCAYTQYPPILAWLTLDGGHVASRIAEQHMESIIKHRMEYEAG